MDKYDSLKLENQLCFPIYVAAKEIVKSYQPYFKPFDLTYTQYIVLLALWQSDGAVSVGELGERLYLDSGTLTPVLKRLETKGYISRQRGSEDERVVNIVLTESGRELREKAADIPKCMADNLCIDRETAERMKKNLYGLIEILKSVNNK